MCFQWQDAPAQVRSPLIAGTAVLAPQPFPATRATYLSADVWQPVSWPHWNKCHQHLFLQARSPGACWRENLAFPFHSAASSLPESAYLRQGLQNKKGKTAWPCSYLFIYLFSSRIYLFESWYNPKICKSYPLAIAFLSLTVPVCIIKLNSAPADVNRCFSGRAGYSPWGLTLPLHCSLGRWWHFAICAWHSHLWRMLIW